MKTVFKLTYFGHVIKNSKYFDTNIQDPIRTFADVHEPWLLNNKKKHLWASLLQ